MPIPNAASIHKEINKNIITGHIVLWTILVTAVLSAIQPWKIFTTTSYTVPILQWFEQHTLLGIYWFIICFFSGYASYLMLLGFSGIPLDKIDEKTLGRFSIHQIRTMVDDIIKNMGKSNAEKPSVYIIKSAQANAMSINSYFFNKSPYKNAIYLNSILFLSLNEKELKAIITHELAHFYRYQHPLRRAPSLINTALGILFIIGLETISFTLEKPWSYSFLNTIFILTPAFFILLYTIYKVPKKTDHYLEYLADLKAAEICEPLSIINALLKIGTRLEVMHRMLEEAVNYVEKNPSADFNDVMKEIDKEFRTKIFPIKKAKAKVRPLLKKHKINQSDNTAAKLKLNEGTDKRLNNKINQLKKLKKQFGTDAAWNIIRWEAFDTHIHDNWIDEKELPLLIKALKNDQSLMLFAVFSDNEQNALEIDHPTFRNRLLFIAENSNF